MLPIHIIPQVPDTATSHAPDIVFIMLVVRYVCYLSSVFYCWLVSRSSNGLKKYPKKMYWVQFSKKESPGHLSVINLSVIYLPLDIK
jgi:hypothetical protein